MKRRSWLGASVALSAAATGLGWSLWRQRQFEIATGGLWTTRWPRPQGGEWALSDWHGSPLVLNFWATWCAPCVKELPEIDRFAQEFGPQGWHVLALAIDGAEPVREFLKKLPLTMPVALGGAGGLDLARKLGNDAGGLPYTVVFDHDGRPVQRKAGATTHAELVGWAKALD